MTWSDQDFSDALNVIGIKSGDILFVHSNIGLFGATNSRKKTPDIVLDTILEIIGDSGTLVLPAFTYSFGSSQIFDSKSNFGLMSMGSLSLRAFDLSYSRSLDPMFSIFARGAAADEILRLDTNSSNGTGSSFRKLIDMNAKILSLNLGVGSTLLHEMENKIAVQYRFMKQFSGEILNIHSGKLQKINWSAYVRKLEIEGSAASFKLLNKDFIKTKYWKSCKVGKGIIGAYDLLSMEQYLFEKIKEFPNYLTQASSS
jgi:aminoglycoside 3-N-acetyltransferase